MTRCWSLTLPLLIVRGWKSCDFSPDAGWTVILSELGRINRATLTRARETARWKGVDDKVLKKINSPGSRLWDTAPYLVCSRVRNGLTALLRFITAPIPGKSGLKIQCQAFLNGDRRGHDRNETDRWILGSILSNWRLENFYITDSTVPLAPVAWYDLGFGQTPNAGGSSCEYKRTRRM